MSEISNPNNMEDKKEDQNDIRARHFFVINESLSNSCNPPGLNPPGLSPAQIRRRYNADRCYMGQGVIAIIGAFHYPTALSRF